MTKQEAVAQLCHWYNEYNAIVNVPNKAVFDEKQFSLLSSLGLHELRKKKGTAAAPEFLEVAVEIEATTLCQILVKRFGDTSFYNANYSRHLIYFVVMTHDRPGAAIMLMTFMYLHAIARGDALPVVIDVEAFAGMCREGLPSDDDAQRLWALQKVNSSNLLDNLGMYSDPEFLKLFHERLEAPTDAN